jgi:molybdate transport system substrate-binding protein
MRALICLLFAGAANLMAAAERITVFAAASTTDALQEIGTTWSKSSGIEVVFSFASSATCAQQIRQGAAADLFLSADTAWMDILAKDDLLIAGSRRDLLTNSLVFIRPTGAVGTVAVAPGTDPSGLFHGRLALADPETVPAGKYAKAAFSKLGWWSALSQRLAPASDVRAALKLVASGECELGVVYASDVHPQGPVHVVGTIPDELHPPIRYPVACIRGSDKAAVDLLTYLHAPEAQAIFRTWGFTPLP